jgi:hypothetical protein
MNHRNRVLDNEALRWNNGAYRLRPLPILEHPAIAHKGGAWLQDVAGRNLPTNLPSLFNFRTRHYTTI